MSEHGLKVSYEMEERRASLRRGSTRSVGSGKWSRERNLQPQTAIPEASLTLMKELHLVDADSEEVSLAQPLKNPQSEEQPTPPLNVRFLSSPITTTGLALGTFHILFSNDLYYLLLPSDVDHTVLIITFVVGVMLLIEFVLHVYTYKLPYVKSIFFWLDLVSVASVVPDVLVLFGVLGEGGVSGPNLSLARVGRAARIGAMIGRIGYAKCFRTLLEQCWRREEVNDFEDEVEMEPLKVAKTIEGMLTSKNASLVLLVILGAILLSNPFSEEDEYSVYAMMLLYHPHLDMVRSLTDTFGSDLLYVAINGTSQHGTNDTSEFRSIDVKTTTKNMNGTTTEVRILIKDVNEVTAMLSVVLTVFVIVSMVLFNFMVISDVRMVLVTPIERMVNVVDTLVFNPLARFQWTAEEEEDLTDETGHIVRSIKKMGNLIQVGFGEAGTEIISQNLQHGTLFTMLPGRNVQAVFAFCDIRNFTIATDVLRKDVMFFVNQVAAILHQTLKECGGEPNKNLGDTFLCVWRICFVTDRRQSAAIIHSPSESRTCAEASLSFTFRCRERIEHDVNLRKICEKVGNGYKCELGYGVHFGWAVEGPIGSEVKVDASYLSPHVNLTARLAAATLQYGVDVLLSTDLYNLLSMRAKRSMTRPVDFAALKGTHKPLLFYEGTEDGGVKCAVPVEILPTGDEFDALIDQAWTVHAANSTRYVSPIWESVESSAAASMALTEQDLLDDLEDLSDSDQSIEETTVERSVSKRRLTCIAHASFVTGDWPRSRSAYSILESVHDDPVARNILEYMGTFCHEKPTLWEFRVLDAK